MNTRLCIIMTCLLLSACQTQRERFTSIWSPAEVVEDAAAHPTDYNELLDNPLGYTQQNTAEVNDPNKLLTLTDISGNREYLILDRISQERGVLTALIEFRYVKPQTLPANGMTYHYNQWREQIDCKNKVRILRNTTHYNHAGEIVDTIDYPLPKYKPAELAALSQPNDKVIQYVCERAGETGLAVGDAAVAGTAAEKAAEKNAEAKSGKTKETETKKSKKSTPPKAEKGVKVDEKIDFIGKGKAEQTTQTDKAAGAVSETPPTAPAEQADTAPKPQPETEEKGKKSSKSAKNSKKTEKSEKIEKPENAEKTESEKPEKTTQPNEPDHTDSADDVEVIQGEVPLKPI